MILENINVDILKCKICLMEKSISLFPKFKSRGKICLKPFCLECQKIENLKYRKNKKEHYLKNKDEYKKRNKKYKEEHRQEILSYFKERNVRDSKKLKKYKKEYYQRNKASINKKRKEYIKKNINAKIAHSLRNRLLKTIKRGRKNNSTISLLGCKIDEFRSYLESKFSESMNWENYGTYWHIDHILPCASFDLSDERQQKICFHYTNLQPLTAKDNLSKGKKIL
jgi:hypothetical protein